MAYIGNSPANVGNYQEVDDISSSFNGSTTTFNLLVDSAAISPAKSGQLLVSVNGVMQEPDDTGTNGFKVSGSTVIFSAAPATSSTFWAMYQGQNVDIGTPSAGTVGTAQMSSAELELSGGLGLGDNVKAQFGAGNDLQIYHSGSTSYIQDAGTGDLKILSSNDLWIEGINGEPQARFAENGACTFYYDNASKLATTSTGIDISGNVTVAAGNKYTTVSGNDLNLDAPSTRSVFLKTGGSTALTIANDGNVGIGKSSAIGAALHIDPATNVSTTFGSPLVKVGGDNSWASTGSLYSVGFGYTNSAAGKVPAEIGLYTNSAAGYTKGSLVFATRDVTTDTAPTERMRIQADGSLLVGTTDGGSSGAGDIVASAIFLGGNQAANELDDYEEGTWTATMTSTAVTFTPSNTIGYYTKIGNLVTISYEMYMSGAPSGTFTNTVSVQGLPFTAAKHGTITWGHHRWLEFPANTTDIGIEINDGNTQLRFFARTGISELTLLTGTVFKRNGSGLRLTGQYYV